MPNEVYEVVAQGARYWFLFLMALIAWRSYRWLVKDRRQRKKRLKLLPDAGYVGELVVLEGSEELPAGSVLAVSCEGTLGCLRGCDLYVPVRGVAKKHLWYSFDKENGLRVESYGAHSAQVDGEPLGGRGKHACMAHGSRLTVGEATLRLRMFAGFEQAGAANARALEIEQENAAPTGPASSPAFTSEQWQALQEMQQAQWTQWQASVTASAVADEPAGNDAPTTVAEEPSVPPRRMRDNPFAGADDLWNAADAEAEQAFAPDAVFYPPVTDEEEADECAEGAGEWPYAPYPQSRAAFDDSGYTYPEYIGEESESPTFHPTPADRYDEEPDDASYAEKSDYVGTDEAEHAKRVLWDRYLKGGDRK